MSDESENRPPDIVVSLDLNICAGWSAHESATMEMSRMKDATDG